MNNFASNQPISVNNHHSHGTQQPEPIQQQNGDPHSEGDDHYHSAVNQGANTYATGDPPTNQQHIGYTQGPPAPHSSGGNNPFIRSRLTVTEFFALYGPQMLEEVLRQNGALVPDGRSNLSQPAGFPALVAPNPAPAYQPQEMRPLDPNIPSTTSFDQAGFGFSAPTTVTSAAPAYQFQGTSAPNDQELRYTAFDPTPDLFQQPGAGHHADFNVPQQGPPEPSPSLFNQPDAGSPADLAIPQQSPPEPSANLFHQPNAGYPADLNVPQYGPPEPNANLYQQPYVGDATHLSTPQQRPFVAAPVAAPAQAPNRNNASRQRGLCQGKLRKGVRTPCPQGRTVWKWVGRSSARVRRCFGCLGNPVPLELQRNIDERQEQGIEPCSNCYHRDARGDGGGLCEICYRNKREAAELRKKGEGKGRKRKHENSDDVPRGGPGGPPPKRDGDDDGGAGPDPGAGFVGAVFSGIDRNPGLAY